MSERLFSYGTLQQENVQLATFGRLLTGATDELIGFKQEMVEIADPDVLAKSGERFHPIVTHTGNDADRVAGTMFEISAAELAAADRYEVQDYERTQAQLASGKTAWVYAKRA
ncbi:MAG: gamma-glutamylcyclotransferase [Phycisphaerales bacterium]|nr:gamma-glutamylcyclotransferase [Hyphomonadaceae bacterium]